MKRLQERIVEDTSDEAMTDTFNDIEIRSSGNNDEQSTPSKRTMPIYMMLRKL